MITVIDGANVRQNDQMLDSVFKMRARVFQDRLGWEVSVENGREIDRFDALRPVYLVAVDDDGQVQGTLRLLPTTGPNMLRDVFSELMEGETVESPLIWESSRFCVNPDLSHERGPKNLTRFTTELLCGAIEVGLLVGLTQVVSVYDARMVRIFQKAGYPVDIIGGPKRIGKVMAYAGLFEMSEAMRVAVASTAGITGSVLSESSMTALAA